MYVQQTHKMFPLDSDSDDALMKMDPVSIRARIRQSSHQIDNGRERYILNPEETKVRMARARSVLRAALRIYERRGYDINRLDIKYAYGALRRGDEFDKNPTYQLSPPHAPLRDSALKVVEGVIRGRRSVRRFRNRDVPDALLNKVLEAGIWSPSACCLQGYRFIVVKEAKTKALLVQPWDAPVVILAGLDERPYQFIQQGSKISYNRYLDLGTAIQNMLLMAYALGLGTCIGTPDEELDSIRREIKVPEYIKIITYIVLGWPEDEPNTVPRMELADIVSRERWGEK